jgi:chromosome segregation ATPase
MTKHISSRIAKVREQWRAQFPRLAEERLSDKSVFEIAWLLIGAGLMPKYESVRDVHGSGSPNGIYSALNAFFDGELAKRWVAPKPAPGVPAALMELWDKAMELAHGAAAEQFADLRATLDGERAQLAMEALTQREHRLQEQSELATTKAHAADLSTKLDQLQHLLNDAHHTIAGDADQMASLRGDISRERERSQSLENDLNGIRLKLQDAETTIQTQQTVLTDSSAQITQLTQRSKDLSADLERARTTSQQLEQSLRGATAANEQLKSRLDEITAAYRTLDDQHRSSVQLVQEVRDSYSRAVEDYQVTLQIVTERNAELTNAKDQILHQDVQINLITQERDRLLSMVDRRLKPTKKGSST